MNPVIGSDGHVFDDLWENYVDPAYRRPLAAAVIVSVLVSASNRSRSM